MSVLHFQVVGAGMLAFTVRRLIIAGWTGRDEHAVEHHIRELQEIGVKPPPTVPCFYMLAPSLLTTSDVIEVPREDSSGEVEFVLLQDGEDLYVGVGSDHTDRKVEAYDVTVSKQMCAKPVGSELWRFDEVADHWDALIMRCWRTRAGRRELYQEGSVDRLLNPRELMRRSTGTENMESGTAMFCGTQTVIGALGAGTAFEVELHDPVRRRSLRHAYGVRGLVVAE